MSKREYVVECANDSWGQMVDWVEVGVFDNLEQAKEVAMAKCLEGDGVRMYPREVLGE
jgi:hypothetical protein